MKWRKWAAALLIGLTVGVATVLGQKYLPDSVNNFANSGAVWLIPAFLLSYFWKSDLRNAVLCSILTLFGCVAGYYLFEALVNAHAVTFTQWMGVWTAMAFVGGVLCGLAAYIANHGQGFWKFVGLNFLPAALVAESLDKFLHFQEYAHLLPSMLLSIVLGLLLYGVIHRRESFRVRNFGAFVLLTALGTAFYEILLLLDF